MPLVAGRKARSPVWVQQSEQREMLGVKVKEIGGVDRIWRTSVKTQTLLSSMVLQLLNLQMLPWCGRPLMADRLIKQQQQQQQQFAEQHGASQICQHLPPSDRHLSGQGQAQITSPTSRCLPIPAEAFLASLALLL